ncbi:hypothetical protein Tco_0817058 [Tanacetum coccineum]
MPPKKTIPMTDDAIKQLIAQGVADALAKYEADKGSGNGDVSHDSRTGERRQVPTTRECTYSDFLKCQSLDFKGTKGVISLTQWFEKMEFVFHISNCIVACQIKFATCTLLSSALTWWNSYVKTIGHDAAYGMVLYVGVLLVVMHGFCERGSMEPDLNLKQAMKSTVLGCIEDAFMLEGCGVLADNVVLSQKTMQDEIEIANDLMDQKIRTFAERQAENKRKLDNNNQAKQQPPNKQSVAIAYTAGSSEKKVYAGTLPLCNKCKFHNNGQCTVKCANCKRVGHLTRDCRSLAATNNQRTLTCYECGNQWHYMSDCPELKNRNHRNEVEGIEAREMVYALGGGETNQDLNNMENDINAYTLFPLRILIVFLLNFCCVVRRISNYLSNQCVVKF